MRFFGSVRPWAVSLSWVAAVAILWASVTSAQGQPAGTPSSGAESAGDSPRVIEVTFQPTSRAQIAIWLETADGAFVDTLRLTQAVSYRGIGNRPGAQLMNSGFRWPYGRREGVLPIWAHRRASHPDSERFPRVIFQDRASEGFASRTSNDASRDDYYCLSFNADTTRRDALDAVTCASVFNSDKGRYFTDTDAQAGYAEPWEQDSEAFMRPLELGSLYPPRRDATPCAPGPACADHGDVAAFQTDARRVMPNIDAITMATPPGDQLLTVAFDVPSEWPNGDYVVRVEANVEGDYNSAYNDETFPTPTAPVGQWDVWARDYGYAYRGQPSILYEAPVTLGTAGEWTAQEPAGYGDLHGESGEITSMAAGGVTNDPTAAPGSGADRLRLMPNGDRLRVRVLATNVCDQPNPPAPCGTSCVAGGCATGFACGPSNTCVGECDIASRPPAVVGLSASVLPDEKNSHQWAELQFTVPASVRGVREYEVRVTTAAINDAESFLRAQPAQAAKIDSEMLVVPTDNLAGETVSVPFGGLNPRTTYTVGVRARDRCNAASDIATTEVTTTEINFTTVSPCFVATAAYGTPFAEEIDSLRRFRDRYLMTHAPGRTLVRAYYAVGPSAADVIRPRPRLRAVVRALLTPVVAFADWLTE